MTKCLYVVLMLVVLIAVGTSEGWAQTSYASKNPDNELNLLDLLIARPIGFIAGTAGTGVFIATLPFTAATKSVDKAAHMLIVEPFRFSFSRPFPDESLSGY